MLKNNHESSPTTNASEHDIAGYLIVNGQTTPIPREIEHARTRRLWLNIGNSLDFLPRWNNWSNSPPVTYTHNDTDPMILPNNRNYRTRQRPNAAFEMD